MIPGKRGKNPLRKEMVGRKIFGLRGGGLGVEGKDEQDLGGIK